MKSTFSELAGVDIVNFGMAGTYLRIDHLRPVIVSRGAFVASS